MTPDLARLEALCEGRHPTAVCPWTVRDALAVLAQAREAERLRRADTLFCGWCGTVGETQHLSWCYETTIADLRTRLAEVERSMVDHFTRDHLAGDGPEIDRWKRRVAEVERERQAAESRALRENSRADAQTARGDAIQEHAASLVTRNETLTAALERAQAFLDVTVREWLPSEHVNCAIDSGCAHGSVEREMYEQLDAAVAALDQARGGG